MTTSIQPRRGTEETEELRELLIEELTLEEREEETLDAIEERDDATLLEAGELLTDELTELLTEEWALEAAEEEAMLELRLLLTEELTLEEREEETLEAMPGACRLRKKTLAHWLLPTICTVKTA